MRRVNLNEIEVEYDPDDPEPFRSARAGLRQLCGATDSGASVYEIPPGQSICPYHYEYGEEEDVMVHRSATVGYYDGEETR